MEQWKTVAGYPDYAVSNLGRVKRLTTRTCARAGAILKSSPRSKTHPYLVVDLCRDGKRKTMAVHQLVAAAFLEPPAFEGAEVNHRDGNKGNPVATNLEWVTSSGNKLHAYCAGLARADGENNGQAKLTAQVVRQLRERATGVAGEEEAMAAPLGVSASTVRDALKRRTWRHVG
jgi:hypothetical protein